MKAHNDAVIAALEAAWTSGRVYASGSVPDLPTTPYLVVSVDSGPRGNYRLAATSKTRRFRITVQVVGKSYNEAAVAADEVSDALLDQTVTVAGRVTTACRELIPASIQRDPDGGALMYGFLSYTFTSIPTE